MNSGPKATLGIMFRLTTSGMKAAFNGVPSLSVLDGWWVEGCIEGVTGWSVGSATEVGHEADARALYDKLEQVVLPLFYGQLGAALGVVERARVQQLVQQ
jgi:starch phosphorylase